MPTDDDIIHPEGIGVRHTPKLTITHGIQSSPKNVDSDKSVFELQSWYDK